MHLIENLRKDVFKPDSSGCILVGVNDRKGMVTKSTETFGRLWQVLKAADDRGENISITIQ